jgi:cysteine desulfurase
MRHIYLDYNATTPIAPSVREAMAPFLAEHYGNPSSGHALGRAAHEAIVDARMQAAMLIGADPETIVFTSGGTESNNLALKGVMLAAGMPMAGRHASGRLAISAIEHPAIVEPARFLERMGFELTIIPCDRRGVVTPDAVRRALTDDTLLVSIMHANNETGVIQPIREIASICREREVLLHTDAAQSAGKIRVSVEELGVDLLTIAGHKLYAPKGVGALFVRPGVKLEPLLHGAGHEGGLRAGTENTPYIVGLGKACTLAAKGLDEVSERMLELRERLLARLRWVIGDRLLVHGGEAARLPNTLSVGFPGVVGADLLARAPELCASTGAACHGAAGHVSATLAAMGVPVEAARGTVRLSLGWTTSQDEVDRAANLLLAAWEDLKP